MNGLSLRERNRVETRTGIVRASLELFAAEGFDNVPVEKICEHAGVSRATFFNYFSQKEEVLVEIGRQRLERFEEFLKSQEAWHQAPTLDALIELFVEFARDNEQVGRMGRHVMRRALATPAVAAEMAGLMDTLRAKVSAYLSRIPGPVPDPAVTAENVVSIYFWSNIEWTLEPQASPGQLVRTIERRMNGFFRPLRAAARPAVRKASR